MDWDKFFTSPAFASLITAIVTLIGILVSYRLSKRNLENEISSIKTQHSVERMQDLPARVALFIDEVRAGRIDDESMSHLLSDVYAYGSLAAIKILVSFQETNYGIALMHGQPDESQTYCVIAHLALLISQLKYDLSGEYVNPELYFRLKIRDYGQGNTSAKETLTNLVKNLDLDRRLIPC